MVQFIDRCSSRCLGPLVLLAALLFVGGGCQSVPAGPCRATVGHELESRVGHSLPQSSPCEPIFPPGTGLEDGLTEDEAVAIALWNNAAFQELLVDLRLARADLIQAGLLPNPEFVYFFPVTDKPLKYAFELPLEAIWLRPIRIASAAREADRTVQRLTQAGLNLMRDVRQAYADSSLARERLRVAKEAVRIRGRIAELAQKRLNAGDISPLETAAATIDALQAKQDATRAEYEVPAVDERLRNLLGIGAVQVSLELDPVKLPEHPILEQETLTELALMQRPDLVAARELTAASEARLTLAKVGWVRLLGIGDATSGRGTGHEFGPAFRFTVPIFNWNQGGIARGEGELERARRQERTLVDLIRLEVQQAYLRYEQAEAELQYLKKEVRPKVENTIQLAERAYQEGDVAYLIVLESTRQLLDSYLRQAQLEADVRRTWAELERSVGRRLAPAEVISERQEGGES